MSTSEKAKVTTELERTILARVLAKWVMGSASGGLGEEAIW